MLNLSAYPNCASRLQKQRVRLDEKGFGPWAAAVCVADDFSDDTLMECGGFNFDDRSDENGYRQLGLLEQFIVDRRRQAKERENSPAFKRRYDVDLHVRERAKAMIGAYGIKAGRLVADDDLWAVASKLWPEHVTRPAVPLIKDLVSQLEAIGKKQRPKIARQNLRNVPAHLISERVAA